MADERHIFPAESLPLPPVRRFISSTKLEFADIATQVPPVSLRKTKSTVVQKKGNKYEAKVRTHIERAYANSSEYRYLFSPWFTYRLPGDTARHCQPDILLFSAKQIFICEVKLNHIRDAYYQLRNLYAPVVKAVFPGYEISLIEITRSFDPRILFPEEFELFFGLSDALASERQLSVVQWKL